MKRIGRIKKAVCVGFAAAVVLVAAQGADKSVTAQKETFLFPQFSSSAAADRRSDDKSDDKRSGKITYSFKLAELFEKWFS